MPHGEAIQIIVMPDELIVTFEDGTVECVDMDCYSEMELSDECKIIYE